MSEWTAERETNAKLRVLEWRFLYVTGPLYTILYAHGATIDEWLGEAVRADLQAELQKLYTLFNVQHDDFEIT